MSSRTSFCTSVFESKNTAMDTEEILKLVDGTYKNILEKFNPGARELITAGKTYLKALHGAAAASRSFNEALAKIAVNAQHGGTTDIGGALLDIVQMYKEIQEQQMNILKAFYVDLIVPLEINLEKDTKVVQLEQKKFLQQHKLRFEDYSKAALTMKKQRKKKTISHSNDKEIKSIQAMEEEKYKLDAFCEQSLKNAMTQERRRYGFVLERQCSVVKHWMVYHGAGKNAIETKLDHWMEIAACREALPTKMDNILATEIVNKTNDDNDNASMSSALRKTRSIDTTSLDMGSLADIGVKSMSMPRAKSEYNLTSSLNDPKDSNWDQRPTASALYAYLSSGENQLSFLEGDRIALVGNRAKGWQFGENLRTQMFGWFPMAYTEIESFAEDDGNSGRSFETLTMKNHQIHMLHSQLRSEPPLEGALINKSRIPQTSPKRMFGETIISRGSNNFGRVSGRNPKPGPPPTLPAPVPAPVVPNFSKPHISQSHSFCSQAGSPFIGKINSSKQTVNYNKHNCIQKVNANSQTTRGVITNASLHSSNDSGFSNEPPPQPAVDYSDEEPSSHRVPIRTTHSQSNTYSIKAISVSTDIPETGASTLKRNKDQDPYTMKKSPSFVTQTESESVHIHSTKDPRGRNIIRRTKSFWKFGKSSDILAGMSMWKHRDLVQIENDESNIKNEQLITKINENVGQNYHSIRRSNTNDNILTVSNGIIKHANKPKNRDSKDTVSKLTVSKLLERNNQNITNARSPKVERLHRYQNKEIHVKDQNANFNSGFTKIENFSDMNNENTCGQSKSLSDSYLAGHQCNTNHLLVESYEDINVEEDQRKKDNYIAGPPANASKLTAYSKSNEWKDGMQNKSNYRKLVQQPQKSKRQFRSQQHKDQTHYYTSQNNSDYTNAQEQLSAEENSDVNDDDAIRMVDSICFDDGITQIMKTVKRHEILRQYYSSESDTEKNSTSSDPYDFIVVDDHLVKKEKRSRSKGFEHNNKIEFKTFLGEDLISEHDFTGTPVNKTVLPRSKFTTVMDNMSGNEQNLTKARDTECRRPITENIANSKVNNHNKATNYMTERNDPNNRIENASSTAYDPRYDLWRPEC